MVGGRGARGQLARLEDKECRKPLTLSRSPNMAWAVKAMMGMRSIFSSVSYCRMMPVASIPPMKGIDCAQAMSLLRIEREGLDGCSTYHVHENDIIVSSLVSFNGESSIFDHVDLVLGVLQEAQSHFLVDDVCRRREGTMTGVQRLLIGILTTVNDLLSSANKIL